MASSRAAQAFHLATSSFTPFAALMQGVATSPTHAPPKPPVSSAVFRQALITATSAVAVPWAKAIDASGRLAASIAAASLSFIGDLRSAHRKCGTQYHCEHMKLSETVDRRLWRKGRTARAKGKRGGMRLRLCPLQSMPLNAP